MRLAKGEISKEEFIELRRLRGLERRFTDFSTEFYSPSQAVQESVQPRKISGKGQYALVAIDPSIILFPESLVFIVTVNVALGSGVIDCSEKSYISL